MKELPNSSRPLETLHKDDLYTPAEPTAEIQSWKETARVASLTNSPRCEPSAPLDDARQSRPIQPPGRGRVDAWAVPAPASWGRMRKPLRKTDPKRRSERRRGRSTAALHGLVAALLGSLSLYEPKEERQEQVRGGEMETAHLFVPPVSNLAEQAGMVASGDANRFDPFHSGAVDHQVVDPEITSPLGPGAPGRLQSALIALRAFDNRIVEPACQAAVEWPCGRRIKVAHDDPSATRVCVEELFERKHLSAPQQEGREGPQRVRRLEVHIDDVRRAAQLRPFSWLQTHLPSRAIRQRNSREGRGAPEGNAHPLKCVRRRRLERTEWKFSGDRFRRLRAQLLCREDVDLIAANQVDEGLRIRATPTEVSRKSPNRPAQRASRVGSPTAQSLASSMPCPLSRPGRPLELIGKSKSVISNFRPSTALCGSATG